jgi:hypothetical protein
MCPVNIFGKPGGLSWTLYELALGTENIISQDILPHIKLLRNSLPKNDALKYPNLLYSLRPKKNYVLWFKICLETNDVLLNLTCVHVHVDMQQSISI